MRIHTQVPNLPTARTVGRVKPRSAAVDWMAINFDPWSAGKSPLTAEFVPSLLAKEHEFKGAESKGKPQQVGAPLSITSYCSWCP